MDLVKNLPKSYYLYTLPSDVWCSMDVRSFLIAGRSDTSGRSTLPQQKHFYGCPEPSGRPTLPQQKHFYGCPESSGRPTISQQKRFYGCPAPLGRPYPVHWIVGHTFHSGRSSDDCRTSGPIWASGRPTFSGRPAILYPKRPLFPTTYIYTLPFHGIGLTIHFEPHKNTPHSLSHSSTLNPRFPSVLGAF